MQVNFRMPASLKAHLERESQANGRSLTAEIVYRLQTTLEMDAYEPGTNAHPDGAIDAALTLSRAIKYDPETVANAIQLLKQLKSGDGSE